MKWIALACESDLPHVLLGTCPGNGYETAESWPRCGDVIDATALLGNQYEAY